MKSTPCVAKATQGENGMLGVELVSTRMGAVERLTSRMWWVRQLGGFPGSDVPRIRDFVRPSGDVNIRFDRAQRTSGHHQPMMTLNSKHFIKINRIFCFGALSRGSHPFSFRTRKLSHVEAMVLEKGE